MGKASRLGGFTATLAFAQAARGFQQAQRSCGVLGHLSRRGRKVPDPQFSLFPN